MREPGLSSPFGSPTRTKVLMILGRDGESWGRKIAEELGVMVNAVQEAISGLELDALVVGRMVGRTKLLYLNPSYFAAKELKLYLDRLNEATAPEKTP